MSNGILIVMSGFSGSGKGTIIKELLKKHNNYALSISATTRKPRKGEVDGKDYFFISKEEFEKEIENNSFIEYASYVDNYYGTKKDYVIKKLKEGLDVILEIEIQGALKVKKTFPNAIFVFISPPDAKTLKNRLVGRGTEEETQIQKRLDKAINEAPVMNKYDYIVVNDNLEKAVIDIDSIIRAEKKKTIYNESFIYDILEDMNKEYGK